MKEEKHTCDICHEERDLSELTYFDESYLCEDCLRRETFICRDCGDRHWNDDSADGDLCQTCYDEDYVRCERCDAVIHYDDACYHEDEEYHDHPYCRDCFDMDEIIHDYYYKNRYSTVTVRDIWVWNLNLMTAVKMSFVRASCLK